MTRELVYTAFITVDGSIDSPGGTVEGHPVLRSLDVVRAGKETEGGPIFIHGSGDLARRLGDTGLIDRYNLLMFPFLLTGGKSIFGSAAQRRTDLRLRESVAYDNGAVKLVYDVIR